MYLRAGDDVTVRELLYGLLLMSGNDAGLALAHHCGKGDVETFVMMMNMYAQDLALQIHRLKIRMDWMANTIIPLRVIWRRSRRMPCAMKLFMKLCRPRR